MVGTLTNGSPGFCIQVEPLEGPDVAVVVRSDVDRLPGVQRGAAADADDHIGLMLGEDLSTPRATSASVGSRVAIVTVAVAIKAAFSDCLEVTLGDPSLLDADVGDDQRPGRRPAGLRRPRVPAPTVMPAP